MANNFILGHRIVPIAGKNGAIALGNPKNSGITAEILSIYVTTPNAVHTSFEGGYIKYSTLSTENLWLNLSALPAGASSMDIGKGYSHEKAQVWMNTSIESPSVEGIKPRFRFNSDLAIDLKDTPIIVKENDAFVITPLNGFEEDSFDYLIIFKEIPNE